MTAPLGNANVQSSTATPVLLTKEIQDLFLRKNFQNLVAYFAAQNQLLNFNFFELNITAAKTDVLSHNLGYIPKDVIVTQLTGAGSIQFLYGKFNNTQISYTATGACRVRFFVGTYYNDKSTTQAQSTDIQSLVASPYIQTLPIPVAVSGTYQMLGTEALIRATAGAGGCIVNLPKNPAKGLSVTVQKVDTGTNPVSIFVSSPATMKMIPPSVTSLKLTVQWSSISMIFDGTNWCVYSKWSGT